ncbi:hypothetical protein ALP29_200534 [Pseudomonas syringae pv. avii]|uniref:Uncharacterized protein n=1 Tax=Pseudomonas syringae pv. avii TaxID=663959 RepID=A0A3M5V942_PSESX|nr:hypothetical protein ALP29_200534 [Pseudomonas syringae pv. avii]
MLIGEARYDLIGILLRQASEQISLITAAAEQQHAQQQQPCAQKIHGNLYCRLVNLSSA